MKITLKPFDDDATISGVIKANVSSSINIVVHVELILQSALRANIEEKAKALEKVISCWREIALNPEKR